MNPPLAFIAGSTGATGRTLQAIAQHNNISCTPHVRTKSADKAPPNAAILDLDDSASLQDALSSCDVVVQLIGTMRKRFASGDTYETSDIGTTQLLVNAARESGVKHIVLLSSVGAGKPRGAYLKAKARAEAIVLESAIPYTIFRPSMFEGDYHGRIPGARKLTEFFGMKRYQPIALTELAGAILHVAQTSNPLGEILEGESLWREVERARGANFCSVA